MIFDALATNDIDVYIDYSGTLWANQFHHSDIRPREELLRELKAVLAQQKITLLGELGFNNVWLVTGARFIVGLGVIALVYRREWQPALPPACAYAAIGTLWLAADEAQALEAQRKQKRLEGKVKRGGVKRLRSTPAGDCAAHARPTAS